MAVPCLIPDLSNAYLCSKNNISLLSIAILPFLIHLEVSEKAAPVSRRDRIVVSTLRCGRSNPGPNPGHGIANTMSRHKGSHFAFGEAIPT